MGRRFRMHIFEESIDGGNEAFVVVDDWTTGIIKRSGNAYRGVPITDAHQREPLGLARALLGADPLFRFARGLSGVSPRATV